MVKSHVDPPPYRPRPTPPDHLKRRAVYIGVRTVHRQAEDMLRTCGIEGTNAKQHLTPDGVKQLREQVRFAQQALFVVDQYLDEM